MASAGSMGGWFYDHHGERFGPISMEKLRELVASGQLEFTDRVWLNWTSEQGQSRTAVTGVAGVLGKGPPPFDLTADGQADAHCQDEEKPAGQDVSH
jgi:GYF domain 2